MIFKRLNIAIFKSSRGFTLLETIIALVVITAAVVGPVYLITKGIFSSAFSRNKLIANNLAQEALEAVRVVRENNVICSFLKEDASWSWLQDSDGAGSLTGSNLKADVTQIDTISCAGKSLPNPRFSANCNEFLKISAGGQYGYSAGSDTIFQRCVDVTQPGSAEGVIPASDIADVTVTLTWNERGLDKSTVVKERIYNWK
ncbi:MAG: prepilin-type N-terminal cleavage/methylation domain-containing protein [bacterium]|nr:prepilin-type N-terminal cleavage/methylation domain-containing protein [bacterium]